MRKVIFIAALVLICFSSQGFAATTLINDNFDSYTAGTIPPSPWEAHEQYNGTIRINSSVSFSSPNSVAVTSAPADAGEAAFGQYHAVIYGRVTYEAYLRTNNVNNETLVMTAMGTGGSVNNVGPYLSLGGPDCCTIPQGHLAVYDGSSWTDVMAINNDTWYHIKLDVNVQTKTYDVYVNNMVTPIRTGVSFFDTTLTNLNAIAFLVYDPAVNANPSTPAVDYAYVDNVLVTSNIPAAVPTMNEWGIIIFLALAGLSAVYYLRRQKIVKR